MTAANWTCWRDERHEVQAHPLWGWPQCMTCRAAPPYHERPEWLPDNLLLTLYVPNEEAELGRVTKGSAIVGVPEGDTIVAYFEGWVHGPMQYAGRPVRELWVAGVENAASRMVTEYPTVARTSFRREQLRIVGTYNPRTRELLVADEGALTAWLA